MRQWEGRYAIHAGRNLPAKEFRYLRTVRVTAAVYEAYTLRKNALFSLNGTGQASDAIRHIAILLSPVFLINSRHPLVLNAPVSKSPPPPKVTESFCRVP